MTADEILRIAGSVIWLLILVSFRKPAWRFITFKHDMQTWEALMGATWLLAGNRLTIAAAAEFDPGDVLAYNFCQGYALIAGVVMLLTGLWACRVHRC